MRARLAFLASALLAVASQANAQEPPPPRFEVVARGPVVSASLGMSRAGYRLFGDLGVQTVGLRSFGPHWLLAWDLGASFTVGALANVEPYRALYGARASAFIEPTYRFLDGGVSPVVSARLSAGASLLGTPGITLGELGDVNDMDGVGGVTARGSARIGAGASFLDRSRSLLLVAFFQESLRSHGQNSDGAAFSEVGGMARFDWTWGLSAALEATAGTTLLFDDPALGRTWRTTRLGLAGDARKIFANGMWLGLFVSVSRETDHVTYVASGTTFEPAGPADFTMGAAFGVSLWRAR
jgi:hypothetical protein